MKNFFWICMGSLFFTPAQGQEESSSSAEAENETASSSDGSGLLSPGLLIGGTALGLGGGGAIAGTPVLGYGVYKGVQALNQKSSAPVSQTFTNPSLVTRPPRSSLTPSSSGPIPVVPRPEDSSSLNPGDYAIELKNLYQNPPLQYTQDEEYHQLAADVKDPLQFPEVKNFQDKLLENKEKTQDVIDFEARPEKEKAEKALVEKGYSSQKATEILAKVQAIVLMEVAYEQTRKISYEAQDRPYTEEIALKEQVRNETFEVLKTFYHVSPQLIQKIQEQGEYRGKVDYVASSSYEEEQRKRQEEAEKRRREKKTELKRQIKNLDKLIKESHYKNKEEYKTLQEQEKELISTIAEKKQQRVQVEKALEDYKKAIRDAKDSSFEEILKASEEARKNLEDTFERSTKVKRVSSSEEAVNVAQKLAFLDVLHHKAIEGRKEIILTEGTSKEKMDHYSETHKKSFELKGGQKLEYMEKIKASENFNKNLKNVREHGMLVGTQMAYIHQKQALRKTPKHLG